MARSRTKPRAREKNGRIRSQLEPFLSDAELAHYRSRSVSQRRIIVGSVRTNSKTYFYRPSAVFPALDPTLDKALAGPLAAERVDQWRWLATIDRKHQMQAAYAYEDDPKRAQLAWSLPEWERILMHNRVGAGQGHMGRPENGGCVHEYHDLIRGIKRMIFVLKRPHSTPLMPMNDIADFLQHMTGPLFGARQPIAGLLFQVVAQYIRKNGEPPDFLSIRFCYRRQA